MFDKEFKKAIENLPSTDKDKLIFRLLRRDLDLANRLHFELVDTETAEQKREKLSHLVSNKIKQTNSNFYSMGYLFVDIRYISGDINEHVRITKDKFGEISLNLQMLIEVLTVHRIHINNSKPKDVYKVLIYVIARAFKILLLIKALDEDYLVDFKADLSQLGNLIGSYDLLMKLAIQNGLDVNWLVFGEIPENIVALHKQLRADGFLK
jgi:hypothetical protein